MARPPTSWCLWPSAETAPGRISTAGQSSQRHGRSGSVHRPPRRGRVLSDVVDVGSARGRDLELHGTWAVRCRVDEGQKESVSSLRRTERPCLGGRSGGLAPTSRCSTIAAARGRGRHAFLGPPSFSSQPHSPARVWRGPGERPRLHGIVTGRRSTAKSTVRVGGVPPIRLGAM